VGIGIVTGRWIWGIWGIWMGFGWDMGDVDMDMDSCFSVGIWV